MFPPNTRLITCAMVVAVLSFACGVDDTQPGNVAAPGGELTPRTAGSTTSTSADFWPPPDVTITRDEAIEIALRSCTSSAPEVTEVEDPHNPVARLLTRGEYEERQGGSSYRDPSALIWVVQFEGVSYGGGITTAGGAEPPLFRYVGCNINAQTGEVQGGFRRRSEPFLLPQQVVQQVPNEIPDPNYGIILPTSGVATFSRNDLIALVKERFRARYYRPEWAEIELVAYTESAALPDAPPTPWPATPTPPAAGETVTPRPEATRRPVSIDRLSWLVIVPTEFGYDRCFGGPIRSDTRSICFFPADWMLIDALTGEIVPAGGGIGLPSPRVTGDEFRALERFAWAEGWWELWHRVKEYSGERLPAGLAAQLDWPDAPRPTPYPTSTPDPGATPRPTPTPAPTQVPDSSQTFGQVVAEGILTEGTWRVGGFMRDGTFCLEFHLNSVGRARCGYTRSHFLTRLPIRVFSESAIVYGFSSKGVALVRIALDNGQTVETVPLDFGYEPDNFFAVQLGPPLDFSKLVLIAIGQGGEELERLESSLEISSIKQ